MKICTKCKKNLSYSEFSKGNDKFGLNYKCRKCGKLYRIKYKKEISKSNKKYRNLHKKEMDACHKNYCIKNKEKLLKYNKEYYIKNKKTFHKYYKEHRNSNLVYFKKSHKKYYEKNKIKILKKMLLYTNLRRKTDIKFRLVCSLRKRTWRVLRGNCKSKSTMKLLGCSIDQLKQHLESKFKPGMTWLNYGLYGWHIDHKRPCASFDLSKPSEQKKCFHYTNLQPLWAKENLEKNRN